MCFLGGFRAGRAIEGARQPLRHFWPLGLVTEKLLSYRLRQSFLEEEGMRDSDR